jgi:ubiquinone/menaquinone biosynthesis C-methylase UbiE
MHAIIGAMSERPSSLSFEPIADRYDATRGGDQRGRRTAANLAPLLDPAAPVLEVGIGTGIVALALRQLGLTVVGVDLSPAMAQRARRRLGPVVAVAHAAQLPVADAAIQQAVSVWLLHLVADRAVVLAEVARALRPGGRYLVCSTSVRVPPPGRDRVAAVRHAQPAGPHRRVARRRAPGAGRRPSCWLHSRRPAARLLGRGSPVPSGGR